MGHGRIAGVQRLRRETRLERSRVARCHGIVTGPASPGPGIGHGSDADGFRAAGAVKRNIPGSGINRLASARFRDKGRVHRECHCVGRLGGTLIIRHRQREDMGHGRIAGVQRLRRETRLERSRVARCHGIVTGPAGPGPSIGHGSDADGFRAATAVKIDHLPGGNDLGGSRFRDKGRKPRRGDRECHCVGRLGGTLIIRHRQREDMGHGRIAGVQRLRRETRLERSRVARRHGIVTGPAGPGPGIGHGSDADGFRAAGAVKRNIPGSGINRLRIARFRDKGRVHRECHCVGRLGGTLIIRHRQREDMGHGRIAGVQRLRRETRLERSRVARCHGIVTGPAGPGPGIGHGSDATGFRAATAVKIDHLPGGNDLGGSRFRDKGRKPRRGDRECHCVGRLGGTLIIRHRQREDMGHGRIAGVQRLRRETRLERSRVARCHGIVTGPAGPGPGIGHGSDADGFRAAGAVKRNIPGSGINRLASARFRDKGRVHRECHCVGRLGGTLIIRHRQREDMGHGRIAGVQRLRRETRLERSRVARCHGIVTGPAGPGPGIGHGSDADGFRAAGAVKRNHLFGIHRPVSARYRDKGRKPRRGDRECHCGGRLGGTLIIRHRQREDMGHGRIAGVQRLRRETRLERSRVARCHGIVTGPAGPGPGIGHGSDADGFRAAGAVKRNIPGSGINRLASARFRDKGRVHRECHCVGRLGGTLIIRHRQREDMGHGRIAGVQRLRRETRLERSRVARRHGIVTGPAGPGPGIGHGSDADGFRAAGAVKRNIPGSGINRLRIARFRDKGRVHRECHCVGRLGGTLIIRHRQREDMGHGRIAGVQRLRRETRLERSRVARSSPVPPVRAQA